MALIDIKGLSKIYGLGDATTVALDEVDLKINKGEFVAVMGPSGSGKSTLMNMIGLLDTPSYGSYSLSSKPVSKLSGRARAKIRREKIGFVFQSFNLLTRMNVIDNVALPLMYSGLSGVQRLEKASKILTSLEMQNREYYRPNQLSGGQTQRVAIARALANDPSIILADEPTGNLDTKTGKEVLELLEDVHSKGNTIIMITHDPKIAAYAERTVTLVDGKINSDSAKPKPKKKAGRKKKATKAKKGGK